MRIKAARVAQGVGGAAGSRSPLGVVARGRVRPLSPPREATRGQGRVGAGAAAPLVVRGETHGQVGLAVSVTEQVVGGAGPGVAGQAGGGDVGATGTVAPRGEVVQNPSKREGRLGPGSRVCVAGVAVWLGGRMEVPPPTPKPFGLLQYKGLMMDTDEQPSPASPSPRPA